MPWPSARLLLVSALVLGACDAADPAPATPPSAPPADATAALFDDAFRGLAPADADAEPAVSKGGYTVETIDYDPAYDGPQAERRDLQLYLPTGRKPYPWVLYVHGGGYQKVNPHRGHDVALGLVREGYAVALVGYRLSPGVGQAFDPDRIRHPDHVRDLAAATRWMVDHASEYGMHPHRRALIGHSSGAHLASVLLANPTFLAEQGLRTSDWDAAVLLDGLGYRIDDTIWRFRGAMPDYSRGVFGVDRVRQRPAGARPVGYNAGALYDVASEDSAEPSGAWLYPELTSGPGEPEAYAAPHALNLSPYYNAAAGDPVAPVLTVYGTAPGRRHSAEQFRDVVLTNAGVAASFASGLTHNQHVTLFDGYSVKAQAYRQAVVGWLTAHVR